MSTPHQDSAINIAIVRLNDALCSWERTTGIESVLIISESGGWQHRSMNGKPGVPDELPDEVLLRVFAPTNDYHPNLDGPADPIGLAMSGPAIDPSDMVAAGDALIRALVATRAQMDCGCGDFGPCNRCTNAVIEAATATAAWNEAKVEKLAKNDPSNLPWHA